VLGERDAVRERVAGDLLIERLVAEFEASAECATNFVRVVTSSGKHGSSEYRQAILADFLEKPQLLEDLREMLKSYDGLRKDWQELRTALGTYASLKATAEFVKATLTYFSSIHAVLGEYEFSSDGLRRMKEWLLTMSRNSVIAELSGIAELFREDSLNAYEWSLQAALDDTLAVSSVRISAMKKIEDASFLKRVFSRKVDDGYADLGEFHAEEAKTLLSTAMYELYYAMTAVAGALYEIFRGLSTELDFYTSAVKCVRYLEAAGTGAVFPVMSADAMDCTALYDPLLIAEGLSAGQIVRNDVRANGNLLVRGLNAAGKTSLLRAVGIAVLFGNAGLPICAGSAVIPEVNAVYTQFSKAEQLGTMDEAGRFEQEVREIAEIVRANPAGSLVLLNETFQTTSYAEGAEAIKPILQMLERKGGKWIFVTHLTPLLEAPPTNSTIRVMRNYRLE
jgi:DNA mismatch repair ATPase MutS